MVSVPMFKDPIGLAGGINMYAYVGNSPLNFVDPLGLISAKGLAGVIIMGVGVVVKSPPLIIIGGVLIVWDWYDSTQKAKKKGKELATQLEKLRKHDQDRIKEIIEEEIMPPIILNTPDESIQLEGSIQKGCKNGK